MANLRARRRTILGKKVKALRREGLIPAALSEEGGNSIPLVLGKKDFFESFQEVSETSLTTLEFDSQEVEAVISGVDYDPISEAILHVNFQKIRRGEKITVSAPVKIVGEASVVKSGKGMLLVVISELEIECLPRHLPSELEVDVSGFENIGDVVTVGDISQDHEEIEILGHGSDDVVVKVAEGEMEELEEEPSEIPIEEIEATEERGEEETEVVEGIEKESNVQ